MSYKNPFDLLQILCEPSVFAATMTAYVNNEGNKILESLKGDLANIANIQADAERVNQDVSEFATVVAVLTVNTRRNLTNVTSEMCFNADGTKTAFGEEYTAQARDALTVLLQAVKKATMQELAKDARGIPSSDLVDLLKTLTGHSGRNAPLG